VALENNRFLLLATEKYHDYAMIASIVSGACAGLAVDCVTLILILCQTLYPIDTIKTRMQSRDGFLRSGGFKHVYRGIGPVVIASAPSGIL
jgi:solute carrier family 25 S-adenosylmethionine transporter 26